MNGAEDETECAMVGEESEVVELLMSDDDQKDEEIVIDAQPVAEPEIKGSKATVKDLPTILDYKQDQNESVAGRTVLMGPVTLQDLAEPTVYDFTKSAQEMKISLKKEENDPSSEYQGCIELMFFTKDDAHLAATELAQIREGVTVLQTRKGNKEPKEITEIRKGFFRPKSDSKDFLVLVYGLSEDVGNDQIMKAFPDADRVIRPFAFDKEEKKCYAYVLFASEEPMKAWLATGTVEIEDVKYKVHSLTTPPSSRALKKNIDDLGIDRLMKRLPVSSKTLVSVQQVLARTQYYVARDLLDAATKTDLEKREKQLTELLNQHEKKEEQRKVNEKMRKEAAEEKERRDEERRLEKAEKAARIEKATKLFVGNIHHDHHNKPDLQKHFETFGEVIDIHLVKKYAFIFMEDEHAQEALSLHRSEFHGRLLTVEVSKNDPGCFRCGDTGHRSFECNAPDSSIKTVSVKLFVGDLSEVTTSAELRELFEPYGKVGECDAKGKYGFVHFHDRNEALKACDDKIQSHGKTLRVRISTSRTSRRGCNYCGEDGHWQSSCPNGDVLDQTSNRVHVANVPSSSKTRDLEKLFGHIGDVQDATVIKNYAFVGYKSYGEARTACDILDGVKFNGNIITVTISKPKNSGGPQPLDECYNCGSRGHWSKECPRYGSMRGKRSADSREWGGESYAKQQRFNDYGRSSGLSNTLASMGGYGQRGMAGGHTGDTVKKAVDLLMGLTNFIGDKHKGMDQRGPRY